MDVVSVEKHASKISKVSYLPPPPGTLSPLSCHRWAVAVEGSCQRIYLNQPVHASSDVPTFNHFAKHRIGATFLLKKTQERKGEVIT